MKRIKTHHPDLFALAIALGSLIFFPVPTYAQAQGLDPQSADWKRANEQVGKFLRGHADILKSEARSVTRSTGIDSDKPRGKLLSLQEAKRLALQTRPSLFSVGGQSLVEQTAQVSTVMGLLSEVERAWTQAVGMQIVLRHQIDTNEAAQIGDELARRMGKIGNWGAGKVLAASMLAKSEALKLIQVQQETNRARQTLSALVLTDAFELPQQLPDVTGIGARHDLNTSPSQLAAERLNRLPEYASKKTTLTRLEDTAGAQSLQQWSAFSQARIDSVLKGESPLALSVDRRSVLWTHDIKEAISQRQELNMLEQETINVIISAQSEVRSRHARFMLLKSQYLPLAKQTEEEAIYHYNGMFISTWNLLDTFRARVEVEIATVQALIQYWDAHYAYQAYLAGSVYKPPSGVSLSAAPAAGGAGGGH